VNRESERALREREGGRGENDGVSLERKSQRQRELETLISH